MVTFQNGSDMSTTRDLLNDMYCVSLRCGSFQNESGMLQNQPEKWIIQNHDMWHGGIRSLCNYMGVGMLSHLLYSSLGLQLGYKVVYFLKKCVQQTTNLTNYRNCVKTRFVLWVHCTSAHALRAIVNVRCMLEITTSLTLLACQIFYKFKEKHY